MSAELRTDEEIKKLDDLWQNFCDVRNSIRGRFVHMQKLLEADAAIDSSEPFVKDIREKKREILVLEH